MSLYDSALSKYNITLSTTNPIQDTTDTASITSNPSQAKILNILEEKIAGIGVDVYSKEPFPTDHPYASIAGRDNVIFTPHMAWASYEARVKVVYEMSENIKAFIKNERRNRVD